MSTPPMVFQLIFTVFFVAFPLILGLSALSEAKKFSDEDLWCLGLLLIFVAISFLTLSILLLSRVF